MQSLQTRLTQLKQQGLIRTLCLPSGIDFSSNDYLGFAHDAVLQQHFKTSLDNLPVGSTGSRLLRGHSEPYENAEQMLAAFVQRETALLFASGYMANIGLLSSLLSPNDYVFSDALNHASLIDGMRLSGAHKIIFPHRDYAYLEQQLKTHSSHVGLKVIVTESIFSMEGTFADLPKLAELAARYEALLIVDEAHSTGLWGPSLVATLGLTNQVFATIHTAGKALGASGAWVAGSQLLREYLIHTARSFIYSTAPLLALPILLIAAIKHYAAVGEKRAQVVRQRAVQLRRLLGINTSDSPIVNVLIGENEEAVRASYFLQQRGWDVRSIRPPTVPHGTARLRITVKWCNTEEQLVRLAEDMKGIKPWPSSSRKRF